MAYPHDAFPFPMEHQPQANMYFQHSIQYTPYIQQPQHHPEIMYTHAPFPDYVDYVSMGMMPDEYDENAEVSTRPRLTKEQVEVLETQFQAHPKPNSMMKKQLAVQTKLTLPRVANWFQNRRAKAKQQRKQEEFESSQGIGKSGTWKDEDRTGTVELSSKASSPVRRPSTRGERSESLDPSSPVRSPVKSEYLRDASMAALQRSIGLVTNAYQRQCAPSKIPAMPPPERPPFNPLSINTQRLVQRAQTASLSPTSDWSTAQNVHEITSPETAANGLMPDLGFDFGFNQDVSTTSVSSTVEDSPIEGVQQHVVTNDDWTAAAFTAQPSTMNHLSDFVSAQQVSPLPLPAYPESRRGSGSDELTANLGTIALAGTPPVSVNRMAAPVRPTDGEIDIASRRKRPRPAALFTPASASLRSRSYGQLPSTSPAFRPGPPSGNALRHSKSTGHSLNSHYAGIRKCSLPQKSPINLTFAEQESLQRLMAQQTAALSNKTPLTTPSLAEMGPLPISQELAQLGFMDDATGMALPSEMLAKYQNLQSPPHTPFQADYMMQNAALSMPPPSARSQYARFVEYTPPYSAGPLTNSTWGSDGPLQSPDFTGFPTNSFMSPLSFPQQSEAAIPQWAYPSDGAADLALQHTGLPDEHKKTEFFITEFPGQREEYASIAQHVPQPRPKNYVFANTAPSDYDG